MQLMNKSDNEEDSCNKSNSSNEKALENYGKKHMSDKDVHSIYPRKYIDLSHLESLYERNVAHGVTGSQNLGNTCFMNSSIQCMSNTVDLTAYFLSKEYEMEINKSNKLGLGGELAESWYELLHQLWEENYRSVNARNFKYTIARKARMFSGFSQHDAHEFMTFFLDYLNEDLNRIINKPYREIEEQNDDEDDLRAAKRFWQLHLDRNDSIITNLFSGQFKSTIQCPNCKWISKTYDPFNTLSLPIPEKRSMKVFFLPKYGLRKTIKLEVQISNNSLFGDIIDIIKNSVNLEGDLEKIRFMVISNIFLERLIDHKERICKILDNDIENENFFFCCDTDSKLQGNIHYIPLYFKMGEDFSIYPRLLYLTDKTTFRELKQLAFFYSRRFLTLPIDQSEYDNESKILTERLTKSNDDLFAICKGEYEKLFKKNPSLLSEKEKNFLSDLPYELYMRKDNDIKYIIRSKRKQSSTDTIIEFNNDNEPIINLIAMNKDKWQFCLEFDRQSQWLTELAFKDINSCRKSPLNQHTLCLSDCLESFQSTEKLEKNNEWFCKKCKSHQLPHKKMELFYLPKILVIHLKRFRTITNRCRDFTDKITTIIDFPINDLDMSRFVVGPDAENSKYDLYAVCQHYGGCGGGHYTAICKNNNIWYKYNDCSTSDANESDVVSDSAYVLFYRRKN